MTPEMVDSVRAFGERLGVPMLIVAFVAAGVYCVAIATRSAIQSIARFLMRESSVRPDGTVDPGGWGARILDSVLSFVTTTRDGMESNRAMLAQTVELLAQQTQVDLRLQQSADVMQATLIAIQESILESVDGSRTVHDIVRQGILHLARMTELMAEERGVDVAEPMAQLRAILQSVGGRPASRRASKANRGGGHESSAGG